MNPTPSPGSDLFHFHGASGWLVFAPIHYASHDEIAQRRHGSVRGHSRALAAQVSREHQGTNVVPRDDHWHCRTCKRKGIDPAYAFVRDTKTGRLLAPDEVEIRETPLECTARATDD